MGAGGGSAARVSGANGTGSTGESGTSATAWTRKSGVADSDSAADSSAGAEGGSGAGIMTTGIGSAAGGGAGVGDARWVICCSRYSAVILSSELDGTLAAEMPSSFAFASTNLLSMLSFLAMS